MPYPDSDDLRWRAIWMKEFLGYIIVWMNYRLLYSRRQERNGTLYFQMPEYLQCEIGEMRTTAKQFCHASIRRQAETAQELKSLWHPG